MVSTPKLKKKIHIFIACGEASGDELAAHFIESLENHLSQNNPNLLKSLTFTAVGGEKLKARAKKNQALKLWFDIKTLSVMGLFEVLKSLLKLIGIRKQIHQYCLDSKVDIFIGVDSPDFYLALETKLKKQNITTIHLVCPSVYAWRAYRLKKIAKSVDLLVGIFPFEQDFISRYCQKHHLDLNYQRLTHPIFLTQGVEKNTLRNQLQLNENPKIVAVLAGSRTSELKRHLPTLIAFIKEAKTSHPQHLFIFNSQTQSHHNFIQTQLKQSGISNAISVLNQLHPLMQDCECILAKSGTNNLLAAKYQKPILIFYQMNPFSYFFIQKMVYKKYVSLLNWSLNEPVFTELLQAEFNPNRLSREFDQLIANPNRYEEAFESINQMYQQPNQDQSTWRVIEKLIQTKSNNHTDLNQHA